MMRQRSSNSGGEDEGGAVGGAAVHDRVRAGGLGLAAVARSVASVLHWRSDRVAPRVLGCKVGGTCRTRFPK